MYITAEVYTKKAKNNLISKTIILLNVLSYHIVKWLHFKTPLLGKVHLF